MRSSVQVEAVSVEILIQSNIRHNKDGFDRDVFCDHFAETIEDFVRHWYAEKLPDCNINF